MRRGTGLLLAAVLLLSCAAVPLAMAKGGKALPTLPQRLPLQPAPGAPASQPVPSNGGSSPGPTGGWIGVVGIGGLAAGMLALGLSAAARARKAKAKKAPRKTYDAGRQRGRALRVKTMPDAFRALSEARLGEILEAVPSATGASIMVERPRSHTCEEVAGFLSGLFESVWAMDVRIDHTVCAGKSGPCRYHVSRVDSSVQRVERRGFSASGARMATASTPGWSGDRRQSPPARSGGG